MSTEFEEKAPQSSAYRALGQGIRTLHDSRNAEVDILAIPGLGTNPVECWTWPRDNKGNTARDDRDGAKAESSSRKTSKPHFNWLRDPDGLAKLFPKSRIMLYDYASAWTGKLKVRATMKSICTWLLDDLQEKRKGGNEITRPLIIIGHSMGGIVAAKALCIARTKREFEPIITYTIGCAFFGVPFRGSDMAKIALLYSSVFGNDAYESLLSFMSTEKNDTLDEVTNEFMEICGRLAPPIDLFCAWEQVPTAFTYSERVTSKVPGLLQQPFFKTGARKLMETGLFALGSGTHFVEKESAELPGAHTVSLAADHSNLIRFESITSTNFAAVKVALCKMVQMAKINARKRALQSGDRLLPQKFVNQVRQSLEGVDMRSKYRAMAGPSPIFTWLSSESSYQQWLSPHHGTDPQQCYLWLKGGAGLGKTNASLAAIQHLSNSRDEQNTADTAGPQCETFLAYFLCDRTLSCCTAEDVLKSFITQLINQDESLAQHARWFVPNPRYQGPAHLDTRLLTDHATNAGAKATATVDNLWKCLQDMFEDPVVSSVHLVLSNMHYLESTASTAALLDKLRQSAFDSSSQAVRRPKWLFTSRGDQHICTYLTAGCISVIDLDNNVEYGGKVTAARKSHARDAVLQLRASKQYSTDLAYYIRNFVESQSEDERWIDVLCILLRAKPSEESNLSIRKWLKEAGGYSIPKLVDHAWDTILKHNEDATLETEELMQALVIAYEPPTLAELAVLTHINDLQRLSKLVKTCSPVVQIAPDDRVTFTERNFQHRLSHVFFGHAEPPSATRKRYHGLMALRCFGYIKELYGAPQDVEHTLKIPDEITFSRPISTEPVTASLTNNDKVLVVAQDDDVSRLPDSTVPTSPAPRCLYPIRYLFRHLSEAFPDAVQELFDDDLDFWGGQSSIREKWLQSLCTLTTNFKDINTDGMSTLHVAAGMGANDLVSILIDRNGKASSSWTNTDGMTALHVAAFNNHADAVDTLIRAGANLEAGEGGSGTPLHFAALRGNCGVIKLLIQQRANVNAFSEDIGPVINAAIRSGTVDAVQLIMNGDVHFDVDYTKCDAPLSLSAGISEPHLFEDILQSGRSKWLQNVKLLDQALIAASYSGRLQSVQILLKFGHTYTNTTLENAMLSAATEKNWSSVNELLDYAIKDTAEGNRRDVNLDDIFYLAATSREERLPILEKIWTFTNQGVPQDVCDFSLYQATVLNKDLTVGWLLDSCHANPNTSAGRPRSIAHYLNVASSADFWIPLNAAASAGNASMVEALIRTGADVDGERVYALQLAARDGHTNAVTILLQHGADPNKVVADTAELGFFVGTALQAACDNKRIGVVDALIAYGANPNLGGGPFNNPITAATQKAQLEILKLLVGAAGIDVNVFGSESKSTPLIDAATHMSAVAVELLIRHGAELDAKDAAGDTALIKAAWKGDKDCVMLLCEEGADVTYRSPQRGLPISAAANGLHPECATVLADRMGGKIETYREQVKIDPSKEQLTEALTDLEMRDATIDELTTTLTETQEQLESAMKDIDFYHHEKKRLMSESSFQGETYESAGQQVRAMQAERAELLKQLDAAKGQTGLANESVNRVQALLNDERKTNAALRKRQELASLQEEIKAAHEIIETEKHKNEGLQHNIQSLRDTVAALENQITSVQVEVQAAVQATHCEQEKQEALKDELTTLGNRYRAAVLESAAAAQKNAELIAEQEYFRLPATIVQTGRDESPSSTASPSTKTTSPVPQARSPGTPSGFRTIHGQHRPDGSLGGYRGRNASQGGYLQRQLSENLYESSVQDGRIGERTLSTQTSRSDGPSMTGSDEAKADVGWPNPTKNGDRENVRYR